MELFSRCDKEIFSCEKLGHMLTAQEVILIELNCESDKYKPGKDRYKWRIQELTKKTLIPFNFKPIYQYNKTGLKFHIDQWISLKI